MSYPFNRRWSKEHLILDNTPQITDKMVERAARAIWLQEAVCGGTKRYEPWRDVDPAFQQRYGRIAKSALTAALNGGE